MGDTTARQTIEEHWGGKIPSEPGRGNRGIFDAAVAGSIKGMLLLGDHVHYEDGSLGEVSKGLEKLDFLVVTDAFNSSLVDRANVVFPAAQWAEKTGTFTSIERRVQILRHVITNKQVDSRMDLDLLIELGKRLGGHGFDFDGPQSVFAEISRVVPEYAGLSYDRLLNEATITPRPSSDNPLPTQVLYSDRVLTWLQWPVAGRTEPDTPLLYAGGHFRYGKATLGALNWFQRPTMNESEYPLVLAHGRVLAQPGTPMEIVKGDGLNTIKREEKFLLNPTDAEQLGLEHGARAAATTAGGAVHYGVVEYSDSVLPGIVSLTTLFGEMAGSLDSSIHPDPMNHIPRLNAKPVRIVAEIPSEVTSH